MKAIEERTPTVKKSLKSRLLKLLIPVCFLPSFIVGMTSYFITNRIINEKELERSTWMLREMEKNIVDGVNTKRLSVITLASNPELIRLLGSSYADADEKKDLVFDVMLQLNDYDVIRGTQSVFVASDSGQLYGNLSNVSLYNAAQHEIQRTLTEDAYVWDIPTYTEENIWVIPMYRRVYNHSLQDAIGILALYINERYLYNTYKSFLTNRTEYPDLLDIVITNADHVVISSSDTNLIGKPFYECPTNEITIRKTGYSKMMLVSESCEITGWNIICIRDYNSIIQANRYILWVTLAVCLVCAIFFFLISLFISANLTKPLNKLVNSILLVQEGNLDVTLDFYMDDEIGLIGRAFEATLAKIKQQIAEIYRISQIKRETEMKALLLQINPHFLYNTLAIVIWLANAGKKEKVIEVVDSLGKLLRISLSRGGETVSVRDEIEHITSYIAIQKIRFRDEILFNIQCDAQALEYRLPKILLQPLVENAIMHGIMGSDKEIVGQIDISVSFRNNHLILEVKDNGGNLSKEKAEQLNAFLENRTQSEKYGIGIKNVNDRVGLYYGENYGLRYSVEGEHTIATITVPVTNPVLGGHDV